MIRRKYRLVLTRNESVILSDHDKNTQFPGKIDTGAYRSAIHCTDGRIIKKDGKMFLSGNLLKDHPCAFGRSFYFETDEYEEVLVASSFGEQEKRYEVKLRCKIGPLVFNTTFTLADRSNKLFPLLIGRRALKGRFLVDVSTSNVDRPLLKRRFGKNIPPDEEDLIEE